MRLIRAPASICSARRGALRVGQSQNRQPRRVPLSKDVSPRSADRFPAPVRRDRPADLPAPSRRDGLKTITHTIVDYSSELSSHFITPPVFSRPVLPEIP